MTNTASQPETTAPSGEPVPLRFTDYRVPDPGIRKLFGLEARWESWLQVEAALARAQATLGIVPAAAAEAITTKSTLAALDIAAIHRGIAATSHPLMALITGLSQAAGEQHGGWVHWGATTQNITQTGDLLQIKKAHLILLDQLEQSPHRSRPSRPARCLRSHGRPDTQPASSSHHLRVQGCGVDR